MATPEQAIQTQLANIQKKTGRTLAELATIARESGLSKHSALRDYFKSEFGLGHGDANTLVHILLKSDGASAATDKGLSSDEVVDEIYTGAKAALRPIHDAVMAYAREMGEFEIAPKKGYISLRRKKQFAMLGPATNTRVELGLNMKGEPGTERLLEQPSGGMCSHKVKLTEPAEVDGAVAAWLKQAYDAAG